MKVNNAVIDLMEYEKTAKRDGDLSLYDYFDPQIQEKPGELDFSITLLEESARLVNYELDRLKKIKNKLQEVEKKREELIAQYQIKQEDTPAT